MDDAAAGLNNEMDRFSRRTIIRTEAIYESGFQISGGRETIELGCKIAFSDSPQTILDIGCGSGGAAIHLAKKYGAKVTGIDLSEDAIALARERNCSNGSDVVFCVGDIRLWKSNVRYDAITCFDVLMYVNNKETVFKKCHEMLSDGGTIFGVDYGAGGAMRSSEFEHYSQTCNLSLSTSLNYEEALVGSGFSKVVVEDVTSSLLDHLRIELQNFTMKREKYLGTYSDQEFETTVNRWMAKISYCEAREFVGIRFSATR